MPKRNILLLEFFLSAQTRIDAKTFFPSVFAESFVGGACCVAEGSLHALSASRVIMFCLIGLQAARERGFLRTGQMAARVVVWEKTFSRLLRHQMLQENCETLEKEAGSTCSNDCVFPQKFVSPSRLVEWFAKQLAPVRKIHHT